VQDAGFGQVPEICKQKSNRAGVQTYTQHQREKLAQRIGFAETEYQRKPLLGVVVYHLVLFYSCKGFKKAFCSPVDVVKGIIKWHGA
jgi:hypothetical protein